MLGPSLSAFERSLHRVGACLLAAFGVLSAAGGAAAQDRPNIILFLTDDQGWNGTSVEMDPDVPGSRSDYYLTPNLETLAERGMRFSRAYSSASLCQPTRAAIQTGMSPAQLQYTSNVRGPGNVGYPLTPARTQWLDPENLTIPRWLEQHRPEYVTANIGKWHLIGVSPEDLGFDVGEDRGGSGQDPKAIFGLTDLAVDFMEQRVQNDEPFYLQLGHNAVHSPIRARPETIEMFENRERGTVHRSAEFAAMTYDLDASLGTILDAVGDLGIEDNTYIIFASDNGSWRAQSLTNPLAGGKNFLQEGGIRVPMVVSGPGIEAGSISRVPVITTDFLSTISDLAGIEAPLPDNVEGTSITPALFNGGDLPPGMDSLVRDFGPNGELFVHSPHNFGSPALRVPPVSVVIRGDWKLFINWAEDGGSDQIYLTNLAERITEPIRLSADAPGNRAEQFPELAADLEATLRGWLEGVDASLAYDVKKDMELHWDASQPGANPQGWRSTIDVDYVLRETWQLDEGQAEPQLVEVRPFQPGLAERAFHFDGGDRMTRKYFHVSDLVDRYAGTPDLDRSATFEFWLRLDALEGEQVLFESGDAGQGLSITLGDGDGDGVHNEVRMRARGDDGQSLAVTAEIDQFSNPARDFVHLVGVLNDSPEDRYAELYVNGAPLARTDGQLGPEGSIRWDTYGTFFLTGNLTAGLGGSGADGLGAASGSDDLPFGGGRLRGDIASMRFFNHALPQEVVGSHYHEALGPPGFGVAAVTGDLLTPQQRPHDVSEGALESSDTILAIHERTDVLDSSLTLDFAAPSLEGLTLAPGTEFASYLLHFDPAGDPDLPQTASGEIWFAEPVLGVLYEPGSLSQTDALLGSIGRYDEGSHTEHGFFSLAPDGRKLTVLMNAMLDEVIQLRVLTEPAELLEGDYTGDLAVNQGDLDLVLLNWGDDGTIPPVGWRTNLPGGFIGQAQLDAVLLNWGVRRARGATAAVPEPASTSLLLLGAVLMVVYVHIARRPRRV